jgi:protein O-mannosyl-transferase
LLALALLILAAYSNSFQSGLVFDNAVILGQDPRIHSVSADNLALIFTKDYWYTNATSGLFRPLTTLSYLVNYAVLGNELHPAGYHLVNLGLHIANVALVYALGVLILEQSLAAVALAALWGVHPLLTESVTNIVGRADLLAAFGVLAGLLCAARSARSMGRQKIQWLAALALAQNIGLFSKESAVVLPATMLLYDLTWTDRASWRERWPAYAAVALPILAFFLLRTSAHSAMHIVWSENPLVGSEFLAGRLTAVKVIGKFLWLFLWPARFSADYSFNAIPLFGWGAEGWEDAKALIAGAAILAWTALAALAWRREKPLFFFTGFFFAAMAPTSNLIVLIGSIMGERFIYLGSVGLAGCVVAGILAAARRLPVATMARRAVLLLAVIVCLALAARTYARNRDWRDDLSLWTSAATAYPEAARARNNLGNALSPMPGRLPDAVAEFEAALKIRPDYAEAHYNLANAFAHSDRLLDAIGEYQAALRFPADHGQRQHETNVHINLGNALARVPDRLPDAMAEFQAAIRLSPGVAAAHYDLGNALARTPGRMDQAIAEFRAALRIQPDLAEAHYSLGSVLLRMPDRAPEAIAEFEAVLRTRPDPQLQHLVEQLRAGTPAR